MISTVTTSTITTITSTVTAPGLAASLALIAVVLFLVLVIQKEVVASSGTKRRGALARGLNIVLIPLGVAFVMIAGSRLLPMLR